MQHWAGAAHIPGILGNLPKLSKPHLVNVVNKSKYSSRLVSGFNKIIHTTCPEQCIVGRVLSDCSLNPIKRPGTKFQSLSLHHFNCLSEQGDSTPIKEHNTMYRHLQSPAQMVQRVNSSRCIHSPIPGSP